MASTTSTFGPILRPEQLGDLVVKPLIQESVAGQVLTSVTTASHQYRVPVVTSDPQAQFVAEGAEIPTSDAEVDEVISTPAKLAALTVISRELANDSSPAAANAVGQGISRDLIRKTDQALFSASTTDGPAGIPGLSGVSTIDAGSTYTSIDAFSDAIYAAEQVNATISAFVTNPATAMTLSKLKTAANYNTPLLQPDPTTPGKRQILGVKLLTSPHVSTTDNVVWAISKQYAYFVVRESAEVLTDSSVFFTSDRVAVRGIVRLGFAFPHPPSIVKISTSTTTA
jgi:HK97 family phage major capsid protein